MRTTGLGCMRLSTHCDTDAAIDTIVAALDAGVRWLDTANVYAPNDAAIGHNERLVRAALDRYANDVGEVVVSTKGGLVRGKKRWTPNGKASHLRAACEASRQALGVDRVDVYFLHVVDPAVAIETSVRALARLRKDGFIERVGLSNVTVTQLEAARAVTNIDVVQIELGATTSEGFESGVPEYCRANGIQLLAHRPFGADKGLVSIRKDATLIAIADKHGVQPEDVALSWLYDLDPTLIALPGATRPETARRCAMVLDFDDEDRDRLDDRFKAGVLLRKPRSQRAPALPVDGEVVIVMGAPGAGKTTTATAYEDAGYTRINRDDRGGTLAGLVPDLEAALAEGRRRVVLDNTYPTRAARNRVIEAAWRGGIPVRCDWVDTSIEDAQIHAVRRMLERKGTLLDADAIRELGNREPNMFLPRAQYRYREVFEPPSTDEGFVDVRRIHVEAAPHGAARAIIVDADKVLWRSKAGDRTPRSVDDLAIDSDIADRLQRYRAEGFVVCGVSWRPNGDEAVTAMCVAHVRKQIDIDIVTCHHPAGPPTCWCRRPLPGLGVWLAHRHGLDLSRSIFIGDGAADRTFTERLGLTMEAP